VIFYLITYLFSSLISFHTCKNRDWFVNLTWQRVFDLLPDSFSSSLLKTTELEWSLDKQDEDSSSASDSLLKVIVSTSFSCSLYSTTWQFKSYTPTDRNINVKIEKNGFQMIFATLYRSIKQINKIIMIIITIS
jgi:hypothetical protein